MKAQRLLLLGEWVTTYKIFNLEANDSYRMEIKMKFAKTQEVSDTTTFFRISLFTIYSFRADLKNGRKTVVAQGVTPSRMEVAKRNTVFRETLLIACFIFLKLR
jgi:hypothetical protein